MTTERVTNHNTAIAQVYLEPHQLGVAPLLASWLNTLPAHYPVRVLFICVLYMQFVRALCTVLSILPPGIHAPHDSTSI